MRALNSIETMLIEFLSSPLKIKIIYEDLTVFNVFPEHETIRNGELLNGESVFIVSQCEYEDSDGVVIVISLLLTQDDKFGELDFWKVNDEPILAFPENVTELRNLNDLLNKPE
jgi:hypothetical protein